MIRNEINNLAERIHNLNPAVVVIVLKKIEKYVRAALQKSGYSGEVYVLPFPGNGHQAKFIDGMAEIIVSHIQ